jgi:hypothetical protein
MKLMKKLIIIGFLTLLLFSVIACEKSPEEKYKEFSAEIVAEFGKQLATEESYMTKSLHRVEKAQVYENLYLLNNESLHKANTIEVPEQYKDAHNYLIEALMKMDSYYAAASYFHMQWNQIEFDLENLQNQFEKGWIAKERIDYYKEQKVEPQKERALILEQLRVDAQIEMDNHLKFLE